MAAAPIPIEPNTLLTAFEIVKPLRGYSFDLDDIKRLFAALKAFTDNEREKFFAQVTQPSEMSTEEFELKKENIRNNAFRVTVTIFGVDGENRFGDSERLFETANLPDIIRGIYMTNLSAYQTIFWRHPQNNFQVNISFDKPDVLAPSGSYGAYHDDREHKRCHTGHPQYAACRSILPRVGI